MSKNSDFRPVVPGPGRGRFFLPSESAEVRLTPIESTLYRLFMAHPEGLLADDLVLHWDELRGIYANESRFDDPDLREDALVSLCSESKRVFYPNIARIKRNSKGVYRTMATLATA